MGLWAASNKTVGAIFTIVGSFVSPVLIYDKIPKYIENFNKHRKIEIVGKSRNGVILSTHHMTEAKGYQRGLRMDQGRIGCRAMCA